MSSSTSSAILSRATSLSALLPWIIFMISSASTSVAEESSTFLERTKFIKFDADAFQKEARLGTDDWVVVFCHDESKPCSHMIESFGRLVEIWDGTGRFGEARFGEVNCSKNQALCEKEGVAAFPSAVRYLKGMRVGSWTVDVSASVSMVWQFVDWVKTEFASSKPESFVLSDVTNHEDGVDSSATSRLLVPFAEMDQDTATVGWILVLFALGLVAWVIVDGFELWPAVVRKGKRSPEWASWLDE